MKRWETMRNKSLKLYCLTLLMLLTIPVRGQLLYQITGNGALDKSFIFATNNLTDITFLDSIPGVFAAFGHSNKVITEFVMLDYEATNALRTTALLPDSVRLRDFFSEDEWQQMDEALRLTLGMGWEKLVAMKPQYITEMYRNELFRKWAGYDESRSVLHFFENVASQQNMPVYGLDDIGEALYMMFDREPLYFQAQELLKITQTPEREVSQEKAIRNLYKQGRLLDIVYLISSPDNHTTVSYSDYKVFCARNKEWAKRLGPYLRDGKAFICINAIYLGGDDGLLAELRKEGYRVKKYRVQAH